LLFAAAAVFSVLGAAMTATVRVTDGHPASDWRTHLNSTT